MFNSLHNWVRQEPTNITGGGEIEECITVFHKLGGGQHALDRLRLDDWVSPSSLAADTPEDNRPTSLKHRAIRLNLVIFPNQLERDSRLAEVTAMPKPLSNDLRCRLVECVEEGSSRREAAARFKTAASSAVNVLKLWKETGSVEPRARGGYRHGKLKPHREFILAIVARQHDITMPELAAELLAAKGVQIDPSNLSKFLIAQGLSFKKNSAGIRARQA